MQPWGNQLLLQLDCFCHCMDTVLFDVHLPFVLYGVFSLNPKQCSHQGWDSIMAQQELSSTVCYSSCKRLWVFKVPNKVGISMPRSDHLKFFCVHKKGKWNWEGGLNGQPTTLPDFIKVTPRHPREKDISWPNPSCNGTLMWIVNASTGIYFTLSSIALIKRHQIMEIGQKGEIF